MGYLMSLTKRQLQHRQWYEKNKTKILLQQKQYRIDNIEKVRLHARLRYAKNPKKFIIKAKKAYFKNKKEYRKILHSLKSNGCAICGYNKCDKALDFHHVNPIDKHFPISINSMQYKINRLVNELNKCILLCCNCHREINNVGVGDFVSG
jgi:hypothetical protein